MFRKQVFQFQQAFKQQCALFIALYIESYEKGYILFDRTRICRVMKRTHC